MIQAGILYVVATPIGNLQDISARALQVLAEVDLIACEDTRHSKYLLNHFSITTPLIAYHEHNESQQTQSLLKRLQEGESIALISDAGTPLLSDPGYVLIHAAKEQGLVVSPIPGSCAAIAALSVSGLATDRFTFEGFLPAKAGARQDVLKGLQNEVRTMIFYEAPHRIVGMVNDLLQSFGPERQMCLARELTKRFESIYSGTTMVLSQSLSRQEIPDKGEFVVLVAGCPPEATSTQEEAKQVLEILLSELPVKQAVGLAVKLTGLKKNELYQWALEMRAE